MNKVIQCLNVPLYAELEKINDAPEMFLYLFKFASDLTKKLQVPCKENNSIHTTVKYDRNHTIYHEQLFDLKGKYICN